MEQQTEDDGIIILSTGYNGHTLYSVFTDLTRVPILTKKELSEFSKEIIRIYPDLSEEIHRVFESSFADNYPKKINFSQLGPEPTAKLVEEISNRLKSMRKV